MEIGSNFNFSNAYNYRSPNRDNDNNTSFSAHTDINSLNGKSGPDETSSQDTPSKDEQKEIEYLKKRDLEVKAHEQAHLAAAGGYASGGAKFEYQTGPDGKKYAVGGHVNISTSEEKTPEATIAKMRIVQRAALAPVNPSGQDRQVAASAAQKMAEAQKELSSKPGNSDDKNSKGTVEGNFSSINKQISINKTSASYQKISSKNIESSRTLNIAV